MRRVRYGPSQNKHIKCKIWYMKIILGSASLGRKKLMESLKIPFEVVKAEIDEEKIVDLDPVKMACKRAEAKANAVWRKLQKSNGERDVLIIGADTVGWLGNWVFNKPKSREEAEEILGRLSGKTHKYVSAHCLIRLGKNNESSIIDYDISSVTFRKLSRADITFYLDRVEYLKLCGAYKIMSSPQNFTIKTEGSISNIIGLSLEKLIPMLRKELMLR